MSLITKNIEAFNKLPVKTLSGMGNRVGVRLWIEDGKITGYMHGDDGKLMKEEIPVKTGNQDGD